MKATQYLAPFTVEDLAIFSASQLRRRMLGDSLCEMCGTDARLQHAWRVFPGARSAMRATIITDMRS